MKAIDEGLPALKEKKKKEVGLGWMKNYSEDVSVYFIASVCSGDTGHKVWNLRKVSYEYVVQKKKKIIPKVETKLKETNVNSSEE